MINSEFEETLERNGDAIGDVKSKCFSACLHVHFRALGGRSATEALAIYRRTPGGLGRGSLVSDWRTQTFTESESSKCLREQSMKDGYACNRDKTLSLAEV